MECIIWIVTSATAARLQEAKRNVFGVWHSLSTDVCQSWQAQKMFQVVCRWMLLQQRIRQRLRQQMCSHQRLSAQRWLSNLFIYNIRAHKVPHDVHKCFSLSSHRTRTCLTRSIVFRVESQNRKRIAARVQEHIWRIFNLRHWLPADMRQYQFDCFLRQQVRTRLLLQNRLYPRQKGKLFIAKVLPNT